MFTVQHKSVLFQLQEHDYGDHPLAAALADVASPEGVDEENEEEAAEESDVNSMDNGTTLVLGEEPGDIGNLDDLLEELQKEADESEERDGDLLPTPSDISQDLSDTVSAEGSEWDEDFLGKSDEKIPENKLSICEATFGDKVVCKGVPCSLCQALLRSTSTPATKRGRGDDDESGSAMKEPQPSKRFAASSSAKEPKPASGDSEATCLHVLGFGVGGIVGGWVFVCVCMFLPFRKL